MKTKELKNILAVLGIASPKSTVLSILENICIEENLLTVTDLKISITKVGLHDLGFGVVDFAQFKKIVSASDEVKFSGLSNSKTPKITFKSDGSLCTLPFEPVDDFPKLRIKDTTPIGFLTVEDVAKLAMALNFVSKDELRPAMCVVNISEGQAASTDAHRLYFNPLSGSIQENINLLPKTVQALVAIKGSEVFEVLREKSGRLKIVGNGYEIEQTLFDEKFPDYRAVIPATNPNIVSIETEVFAKIVKKALLFGNQTTHQVELNMSPEALIITSSDLDFERDFSHKVDGCYKFEGEAMKIGFNGKFLENILKLCTTSHVKIEMSTPNRASIINDTFLLMPVMLDQFN